MKINYITESSSEDSVIKKKDIYKYSHYNKFEKKEPKESKSLVKKCLVKDLDLNVVKPQRAGVIMYTKINDLLYFGLGVDTLSGEYTDFGGGISYKDKNDKNVIEGALREYNEETLGIFGNLNYNDVVDCNVIYNYHNLILFRYVAVDFDNILLQFNIEYNNKIKQGILPEVCNIKWLTLKEFKDVVATRGKIFHRVQCFLQLAGDFTRLF